MSILIIDDNRDICDLILNILLSEDLEATTCSNPLEAADIISRVKPKLIITDMLMSGVDGRTLCQKIRADNATKDIKIIMMSAHPDAKKESENVGVDDFLAKPFEIDDLVNKVKNLLP
ncbi:response regulator [Halpernia frigidisoli]|uniref:Two-component system, OmpR family, alkaline phosphatase synthesis response regulator PhoP n=1 Tax=Halpernia frigidisoli TaxID=1125876 RepID=A0A1I3GXL4_9FLAO|nr:response regulator [Halpernia frigidisoli]SFI28121.1 two-component system, OmpR family, alkaline phosphatase synthesis response regulator PhoP [Halpernia frigidisoli]